MQLVLDYESSALAAPQSFKDAMQAAANILDAAVTNNITVTIQVGYGDYDNGAITNLGSSAVGSDMYGSFLSYSTVRNALASHETSSVDQSFVSSLPSGSSVNGVSTLYVPSAVEKALGMISPTASAIDGAIGIGTSVPTSDLVGVALHELTHAMGREPGAATFDLGRYTSPGTHLFSSASTAPAAYFSVDGGVTKLADYGQTSDPADFLNSGVQGPNDPLNEFYSGSTVQALSTVDLQQLDALGFSINYGTSAAPSAANSSLVASSSTVAADGTTTTTLTVTVKDTNGNPVAGTAVTLSGSGSNNHFGAISGTTDVNGKFTTTLSSTLVQNETITATEGSIQETTTVSFVAGAPSVANSSLVASSPTVTADGTTTTTLTVTVKDANGNAVAGTAVTLSGSGSGNSFGAISGTTDASGKFTTTLSSTLAQSETITATEGSVHETTTVMFVAGAPSAATSSIVASSPTVAADGVSTTALTVTVKDANGNAVAGTAVTLSGSGSGNNFGAITGTTDANGKFTTTLASSLVQSETITATEGSIQESTAVSFVAGVASAATSSIVASSPTVTADGVSTTTLTVTVKDANGDAVAGTAVTLSGSGSSNNFGAISGTTDANGHFTTTLSSALAQTETITATEGGVQETTTMSFVAGTPSASNSSIVASASTVAPDGTTPTVTADGVSTTTLTVTVKDANGNAVAGTAVTLSASGSNNHFGAISGTTDANGHFTTTLSSTLAQTETITATEGGIQETTTMSFVAGAPAAATSSIVASSPIVAANGTTTTTLTVMVEDANGNAVMGTAVTLSGSGSSNNFGAISGTTDANGKFTTTLSSTLAQSEIITATEGNIHETTTVGFVAGAPSVTTSSIVARPSTVTADGVSTTTLTVTVDDTHGNAVAGTAVTLSGSGSNNHFGAISGTTDANGHFTTTLSSTLAQSETITATEGSIHETTPVTFVAPANAKTVIEAFGSTELVQIGNNYYMYNVSTGSGPELKYGNQPVVAGQFGAWTPIAAEQTSNNQYQVVWKAPGTVAGTYQYQVATVKNNGNESSNTGALSATSTKLESLETSFHQDLNGDGVIGVPGTSPVATNHGSPHLAGNGAGDMMLLASGGDGFSFAPSLGQSTAEGSASLLQSGWDNHSSIDALLAAIHRDGQPNAVVTEAAHDMGPLQQIAAILGHHSDFHIS